MPKISELAAGSTPTGAEKIPAVQSGTTVSLTAQQIANLKAGIYISVTDPAFGAVGDGVTDDAPAFRAAYAAAKDGSTIFIPAAASRYLLNSVSGTHIIPMSANKAVSWVGEGWNIKTGGSYGSPKGSILQVGSSIGSGADVFNITGTDIVTGISFRDFAIVASTGTFGTPKGRDGIRIDNTSSASFYCTQVVFDHLFIDNMAAGYSIHTVAQQTTPYSGALAYSRISNCQLMNVRLENVGDSNLIDHNTFGQNATADSRNVGIYTTTISGGTSLRITNNVFSNFNGMIVVDSGVAIEILNNEFEMGDVANSQGALIDLVGGTSTILNVQISGNCISQNSTVGNYYPIRVGAASGVYIHDNRICTPSAYGHINILISAENAHYYSNHYEAPSGTVVQPTVLNASSSTNSQRLQIAAVGGGDQVNITGTANMHVLRLNGAVSGGTTITPASAASGGWSLPSATDTIVGKATTDTLTNKTLDTAGAGNSLKINGNAVSAVTGTGSTVVLSAGPTISGTVNLSGLTASSAVATDGSKNLVSVTNTGSGSNVLGTTPTIATPVINGLPTGTGVATANTVSTLVARDGSGNFSAGTITATLTGTASSATNATNTGITDDNTTNAVMYPTWVTSNTGNLPQKTSSSKMSFNPSTGILTTQGLTMVLGASGASFNSGGGTASGNLNTLLLNGGTTGGVYIAFRTNDVTYCYQGSKAAITGSGAMTDMLFQTQSGSGFYVQTNATATDRFAITSAGDATFTGTFGYGTGAGGTVTQITSRTTGVTLNTACGAITLFAAAPAVGTWVSFTVTNSKVAATDVPHIAFKSGTNTYIGIVTAVAAGSFQISFTSIAGTASDSPVINFDIVKAVTS